MLRRVVADVGTDRPITVDVARLGLNDDSVETIVGYMHCGAQHYDVTDSKQMIELLYAVHLLQVEQLIRRIEAQLLQLTAESDEMLLHCLGVCFQHASVSYFTQRSLVIKVAEHFRRLKCLVAFMQLPAEAVCAVLMDGFLQITNETSVVTTVLHWLMTNGVDQSVAERLFGCVRFATMTSAEQIHAIRQIIISQLPVLHVVRPILFATTHREARRGNDAPTANRQTQASDATVQSESDGSLTIISEAFSTFASCN